MTKRLTNSECKQFKRCKRQWWLSTYRRLQPKGHDFNRPTGIGTRVHAALAAYYDPENPQDPVQFMKLAVADDIAAFPAHERDIMKEADLAEAMVSGYVQWLQEEGKDVGLRVIAAEGAREAPLVADGLKDTTILAKLDARVIREHDGVRRALEFKTTGTLKAALPLLQLDTQLLHEHLVEFLALREEDQVDDAARGVLYRMLLKSKRTSRAKPPFYAEEVVDHNLDELRAHWRHVVSIAREIQDATVRLDAGESHHDVCPPNPMDSCKWSCAFFKVCTMFDDGSDPEAAIDGLYVEGDPLDRYNSPQAEPSGG